MGNMVTASHVKGVVTYPPLLPLDQVEDSQFILLWCDRAVTPHRRASPPTDGHQLIKQRQNTVLKARGIGGGGTCVGSEGCGWMGGEGEVCDTVIYRYSVLSSMHSGAHISCTGNHTLWDLSLQMPRLACQ